jgi:deoxyribose-phosphate aldolase
MLTDAQRIFSLLDLTSLNDTDTAETIAVLCSKAVTSLGHVAAVCVYPQFVKLAAELLAGTPVKIATVANFPHGADSQVAVLQTIQTALADGADEIDVVLPYQEYLAGKKLAACQLIQACKMACGQHLLKVILESGTLKNPQIIAEASHDVLMAGADFLKTSTGKVSTGATLEAATVMLQTIKVLTPQLQRAVGFKVAGGVRTIAQANEYIHLATTIMGTEWVQPEHFRLGASQLVEELF